MFEPHLKLSYQCVGVLIGFLLFVVTNASCKEAYHVMPVHGLIHDGQLRACPCAVLGLMYGLRRLYAIRYLGFQCWQWYKRPNPFFLLLVFLEFLCQEFSSIISQDFQMLTVAIARPPSTYISFLSFFALQYT